MFITKKISSTIYEWYLNDKENKIDFNPVYQRVSGIWAIQSKQLLIDSIFNKYDLPKFYVSYFFTRGNILNPEEYLYAIIDGKQRFHAIFDFLDNKFKTSKNFNIIDMPDLEVSNKTYSEIVYMYPDLRKYFEQYILDIVLVETDEKERIEELFLRLNEGKHLTNAEKRYAKYGFLNDEIKKLVEGHLFFEILEFKDKRYDYYDLALKLFLIDSNEMSAIALNKSNLDKIVDTERARTEELIYNLDKFIVNLNHFSELFNGTNGLLKTKTNIPVYYLFYFQYDQNESAEIRSFISYFEDLRKDNRTLEDDQLKNETLLEFDLLNQQGTTTKESLENRLKIIQYCYELFKNGKLNLKTTFDYSFELE
ncbi:DUF262 domain-containing protein [Mangrovibacillus sp. Mu-81]|uniref:DUF262 domain-containing protein n=1 Tax=Mangrovibacillus sp. Mu-81 TaxID=3121478 RepID=UPI002FE4AC01